MKKVFLKKAFSIIELSIVLLIVGVIIAGIIQSKDLAQTFKLSNARSLTRSSPVTSINGLLFWAETTLDGAISDAKTPRDAQTVSKFNNINWNLTQKNGLVQSDNSKKPLYKFNIINNLPALVFDGIDDYLSSESQISNSTFLPSNTNNTTFVVFNPHGAGYLFSYYLSSASNFTLQAAAALDDEDNVNAQFSFPNLDNAITSDTKIINQPSIATIYKEPDVVEFFLNGLLVSSVADSNSFESGSAPIDLAADRSLGHYDNFIKADIGEVIIYNRVLKTEERQEIEKYLSKKWGIELSTPVSIEITPINPSS